MIQDMYDEEYFIQVLRPQQLSSQQTSTIDDALFYKYYSELSNEQMDKYETNMIDQEYASERGNVLGVTLPNINAWIRGGIEER